MNIFKTKTSKELIDEKINHIMFDLKYTSTENLIYFFETFKEAFQVEMEQREAKASQEIYTIKKYKVESKSE